MNNEKVIYKAYENNDLDLNRIFFYLYFRQFKKCCDTCFPPANPISKEVLLFFQKLE